ncbi:glucosamine-6-phosphate deaminase [Frondihabitans australicus]|uniref:Glucosamine-6-phosphate deaminase n=1 Tax=Frondihabitans australicus TaxID=386892 RepID=A0A495IHF9_9MICO|nr:glucosamine-6-phosphate deaminase [Frondihabitans australicus]RKR75427.1 glucosamine-6-phosphate deaminase [Frondihabitans australicus]
MEIIILPTPADVGRVAASLIARVVNEKPAAVLGLATGSSPQDIYRSLAARVEAGELDVSQASGFALDEYVGIPLDHPESYASVIARDVVEPLGMDPAKVRVPDGRADDIEAATREYDEAIAAAGGVDIQILGIGANGHIGFNEPTSSIASRTRIKTLAPSTREANARFFDDPADVPTHCLTQGLGTILDAKAVVLVAQGAGKADAIAAAVEGPVSAMCPGSALQLHRHATIIVDEAAASKLTLTEYYKYTYANKPAFQRFE